MSNIFIEKLSLYYSDMKVFIIMQAAYRFLADIKAQETEKECVMWTDTLAATVTHHDHYTCFQLSPCFHFTSILWQDMNLFHLHLAFLSRDDIMVASAHTWPFQFDLHFHSKILAN